MGEQTEPQSLYLSKCCEMLVVEDLLKTFVELALLSVKIQNTHQVDHAPWPESVVMIKCAYEVGTIWHRGP